MIVASHTVYINETDADFNPEFANFGEVVDLFAPGDHIIGAWPDVNNTGARDALVYLEEAWSGVAAAYVAGAAALILEVRGLQTLSIQWPLCQSYHHFPSLD